MDKIKIAGISLFLFWCVNLQAQQIEGKNGIKEIKAMPVSLILGNLSAAGEFMFNEKYGIDAEAGFQLPLFKIFGISTTGFYAETQARRYFHKEGNYKGWFAGVYSAYSHTTVKNFGNIDPRDNIHFVNTSIGLGGLGGYKWVLGEHWTMELLGGFGRLLYDRDNNILFPNQPIQEGINIDINLSATGRFGIGYRF